VSNEPDAVVLPRKRLYDVVCAVVRGVADDNNLPVAIGLRLHAVDGAPYTEVGIVAGDENGNRGPHLIDQLERVTPVS
jgi:hypothetical protein